MLSTKDMSVGSGKARPLMGPGNSEVRINTILTGHRSSEDAAALVV